MFTNQSTDITIPGPCRAMDAVHGNKIENRFILGTCAINTNSSSSSSNTHSNSTNANTNRSSLQQQQQQQQRTNGGDNNNHNHNTNTNHLYVVQFDNELNELSIIKTPTKLVTCAIHIYLKIVLQRKTKINVGLKKSSKSYN